MTVREVCEKYNPKKVYCYCNAPEEYEEDTVFYDMGYWEDGHLVAEDFYDNDVIDSYEYDKELDRVTIVISVDWRH